MQYTSDQLQTMTDDEVDIAVAKKHGVEYETYRDLSNGGRAYSFFQPCKNWNDVMVIAEKYDIVVYAKDGCAIFSKCLEEFRGECQEDIFIESENDNPRRAICEVFLMMD
jgi:hypothetical protein